MKIARGIHDGNQIDVGEIAWDSQVERASVIYSANQLDGTPYTAALTFTNGPFRRTNGDVQIKIHRLGKEVFDFVGREFTVFCIKNACLYFVDFSSDKTLVCVDLVTASVR